MDQLSAVSKAARVVVMKGAQLGFTEAGNNWIGYVIHNAPGIMLNVMPSLDDVKRNSAVRIDPLIEHSPVLKARILGARSRDSGNSMFRKKFPGGELIMTGGTSPKGLRSTPVRYLFCDEVDGYERDAGGEGDPIALAEQRTVTFKGRRKIYLVSTPTIKGVSRIEKAFAGSDQRRYFVPCLHCESWSTIEWEQIKYSPDAPTKAGWACPACGVIHTEADKPVLLARGEWRPTAVSSDGTVGFFLSGLYSPFESWGDVALVYEQSKNDPVALKSWTNTKLGLPFDEESEPIDPDSLEARLEDFGGLIPPGVAMLTAGIDTQDDRLEVTVMGWGLGEECWVIGHWVLWGDPSGAALWKDLERLLRTKFRHSRMVPDMGIRAACIDSGGHVTIPVYNWIRDKKKFRWRATKGKSTPGGPFWPGKATLSNKGKVDLFTIGPSVGKDALYLRLKSQTPGPGYIHLSKTLTREYLNGLTAETPRYELRGGKIVQVWIEKVGVRNEPLDCWVLGYAALHAEYAYGLHLGRLVGELLQEPLRPPEDQETQVQPKPRPSVAESVARIAHTATRKR